MTNSSSFELVNKQHACYLAISTWLFNFRHVFSARLDTFSSKM